MSATKILADTSVTNELIARFMGEEVKRDCIVKYHAYSVCGVNPDGACHYPMKYHDDWEWLMPVIERIRTIQLPSPSMIPIGVTIDNYGCYITDGCWNSSEIVSNTETGLGSKIPNVRELTYKTVVEFIEWYNERIK